MTRFGRSSDGLHQRVGHHQAALGVGVAVLHGLAAVHREHVGGTVGAAGGQVLRQRCERGHADAQAQFCDGCGGSDHGCRTGHVALHGVHAFAGLQVQATGVEGDALADKGEVELGATRGVGQLHQARLAGRAAADGDDAAEAFALQRLVVPHLDAELGVPGHRPHQFGEGLGEQVVAGQVHPFAGEVDGRGRGGGELEGLPGLRTLVLAHQDQVADAGAGALAVAVGAEQRAFCRALDHLRFGGLEADRHGVRGGRGQAGDQADGCAGGAADLLGGDVDRADADHDDAQSGRAGDQHGLAGLRRSAELPGEGRDVGAEGLGEGLAQIVGEPDQDVALRRLGKADDENAGFLAHCRGQADGGLSATDHDRFLSMPFGRLRLIEPRLVPRDLLHLRHCRPDRLRAPVAAPNSPLPSQRSAPVRWSAPVRTLPGMPS